MSLKKILILLLAGLPLAMLAHFDIGTRNSRCAEIVQILDPAITTKSKISDDYLETLCNELIMLNCNNKALAYNLLGHLKYNNSKFSEAKALLLKAEEMCLQENSSPKYYSINQNYLALIEIVEKDFESALLHLNKSKAIAISINNNQLLAFAYLNLALAYLEMGDLTLAENFLNKTLSIDIKNEEYKGYAYQNLARIFSQQNKLYEALEMAEASKNVWENIGHKKGLYFISLLQAEILRSINEYDTALEVLIEGRKIGESAGITLLMGETHKLESYLHQLTNNIPEEIVALKKALAFHSDLSFEAIEASVARLTEISESKNNDEIISALLGIIDDSKKSIQANTKRQLNKEVMFEQEIEDIEAQTRKQFAVMGGLLVFMLVIAAFLFRIFRQNQKIKLLNEELLNSKQKIEAQMDELEMRNGELKNFAYVASHDLQSPLKTIGSFTNIIETKLNGQAEKVRPYLNYVKSATDNMSQMISDLLKHATTENALNFAPVSFSKIINDAVKNLKADIESTNTKIKVKNIGSDTIFCDEIKMIGVTQNIISNAINYAKPNQSPLIEVTTKNNNNTFTLTIKDNGIGIDPKYHSKIFEMFNRLKEKKGVDGTGIGLATCLKIVQMHNGSISVNSTPEEGAEFIIQLPIMVDEVVLN